MKKKRYTEEQIAFALRQHESGTPVAEIVRKLGIAEQTFYRWKKQYGGMDRDHVKRLKELEQENARLKKLLAEKDLDNDILKEALRGKY